jgi:chemosensory pili system protein ChpC
MADDIRGIMIPVAEDRRVLLPNAIIAEVVSYKELSTIDSSPPWLFGNFEWRGYSIPVVCYDTLITGIKSNKHRKSGRVAVIKALGDIDKMPYFAIIVDGVPRLHLVTQGDLQVHESEDGESNAIASKVTIQEEMSEIPNIRFLEHVLGVAIPQKIA